MLIEVLGIVVGCVVLLILAVGLINVASKDRVSAGVGCLAFVFGYLCMLCGVCGLLALIPATFH